MDDQKGRAEALAKASLNAVSMSKKLCRLLTRAGFANLSDAFNANKVEIDKVLGGRHAHTFQEFATLADCFEKDPAKFVSLLSQQRPSSLSLSLSLVGGIPRRSTSKYLRFC